MSDPKTTAELITAVRERADLVGSTAVSDAVIADYLTAAAGELCDLLVTVLGEDHFCKFYDWAVPAGQGYVDFTAYIQAFPWRLMRVDRLLNNQRRPMHRFSLPDVVLSETAVDWSGCDPRYDWRGTTLWFDLKNIGAETVRVYFVPLPPVFDSTAGSTVLPHQYMRWDRYLVVSAAIQCRDKQDSDVTMLVQERATIVSGIERLGAPKDTGQAPRQVRTRCDCDDERGNHGGYFSPDYRG